MYNMNFSLRKEVDDHLGYAEFLTCKDISKILHVSESKAWEVVKLNNLRMPRNKKIFVRRSYFLNFILDNNYSRYVLERKLLFNLTELKNLFGNGSLVSNYVERGFVKFVEAPVCVYLLSYSDVLKIIKKEYDENNLTLRNNYIMKLDNLYDTKYICHMRHEEACKAEALKERNKTNYYITNVCAKKWGVRALDLRSWISDCHLNVRLEKRKNNKGYSYIISEASFFDFVKKYPLKIEDSRNNKKDIYTKDNLLENEVSEILTLSPTVVDKLFRRNKIPNRMCGNKRIAYRNDVLAYRRSEEYKKECNNNDDNILKVKDHFEFLLEPMSIEVPDSVSSIEPAPKCLEVENSANTVTNVEMRSKVPDGPPGVNPFENLDDKPQPSEPRDPNLPALEEVYNGKALHHRTYRVYEICGELNIQSGDVYAYIREKELKARKIPSTTKEGKFYWEIDRKDYIDFLKRHNYLLKNSNLLNKDLRDGPGRLVDLMKKCAIHTQSDILKKVEQVKLDQDAIPCQQNILEFFVDLNEYIDTSLKRRGLM